MNTVNCASFAICAATLVSLPLLCIDHSDAAMIEFRGSVVIDSAVVKLGDVAIVSDADENQAARLKQITLMPAPAPGNRVRLDFASIRSRLAAHGVNLSQTEFSGKSFVMVSSPQQESERPAKYVRTRTSSSHTYERAQKLVAAAALQQIRRLAPELGAVKISVRLNPYEVPLILSGAGAGYQILGGAPPWNVPQVLTVRFLDRQEQMREVKVECLVSPYPQVLAVKYNVPRGHVLRPVDLAWQQVESPGRALTQPEDVLGKETTRPIRRGQPIQEPDVQAVPLVRTNDIVTVYAGGPGISVRRPMKARTAGALGEGITLVTLDRREKVLATVVGYHEAAIVGTSGHPKRIQFRPSTPPRRR